MKAYFAGKLVPITNIRNYLYACNRHHNDLEYYIPVNSLADVQVFVPLRERPQFIDIELYNLCNDTHTQITPDRYIIGVDPNGNYYGVFTFSNAFPAPLVFALYFSFRKAGIGTTPDIYFTQAYSTNDCRGLLRIDACFPIRRTDEFGFDVNDIYFGTTTDVNSSAGDVSLSYRHFAYVRRAKVFQDAPKLTFVSNPRRNFQTKLERIYELRTELVPNWYKEYLLALYARGFIRIDNDVIYRVTDLAFESVNEDDRTWKPYAKLMQEKQFQFGCEDCTPLPPPCHNTVEAGDWVMNEGQFQLPFTGTLSSSSVIEWEIHLKDGARVAFGFITQPPLMIIDSSGIDPNESCYVVKWRLVCSTDSQSEWKERQFGNCNPPLQATFSISSHGNGTLNGGGQHCSAQGTTRFRFRFAQPLAQAITIQFATIYFPDNGSGSFQAIGGNIIPAGHPDKHIFNTWGQASGNGWDAPFEITIPAGTTDFWTGMLVASQFISLISFPLCNGSWGSVARHRFYYKVINPPGMNINFTMAYDTQVPFNTVPGGIQLEKIV